MASSMNDMNNTFGAPITGRTWLEEAMTRPVCEAGPWVSSEAHGGLECQAVIKDPPVPNGGDYEVGLA